MQLLVMAEKFRNLHTVAQQLNLSQPAISKSLREFERLIGVDIFVRTPHGLQLTAYAPAVVQMARGILESVERGGAAITALTRRKDDHVAIGSMYFAVPRVLAVAISELNRLHPHVSTEVITGNTGALVAELLTGGFDVVFGRAANAKEHAGLHTRVVGAERLVVVSTVNHPLVKAETISEADVLSEPWVLGTYPEGGHRQLMLLRAQYGVRARQPDVATTSWSATLPVLLSGNYLTLISAELARHCAGMGIAKALPIDLGFSSFELGVITRRADPLPPGALALVERLVESAQRVWGSGSIEANADWLDTVGYRQLAP